jgi:hypothetical protein
VLPVVPVVPLLPELRGAGAGGGGEEGRDPPVDDGGGGAEGREGAAVLGCGGALVFGRTGAEDVRGAAAAPEEDGCGPAEPPEARFEELAAPDAEGTTGPRGMALLVTPSLRGMSPIGTFAVALESFPASGAEVSGASRASELTNLCSRGSKTIAEDPRATGDTPASPTSERETRSGGVTETIGLPANPRGGA